jgi:hypothetical protein
MRVRFDRKTGPKLARNMGEQAEPVVSATDPVRRCRQYLRDDRHALRYPPNVSFHTRKGFHRTIGSPRLSSLRHTRRRRLRDGCMYLESWRCCSSIRLKQVLNHISGSRAGIVGVYQRHDFATEKRAALETWGSHLRAVVEGSTVADNVIALRA